MRPPLESGLELIGAIERQRWVQPCPEPEPFPTLQQQFDTDDS